MGGFVESTGVAKNALAADQKFPVLLARWPELLFDGGEYFVGHDQRLGTAPQTHQHIALQPLHVQQIGGISAGVRFQQLDQCLHLGERHGVAMQCKIGVGESSQQNGERLRIVLELLVHVLLGFFEQSEYAGPCATVFIRVGALNQLAEIVSNLVGAGGFVACARRCGNGLRALPQTHAKADQNGGRRDRT